MGIEPDYYMPTVPLVLINGADGIGTGEEGKTLLSALIPGRVEYRHPQFRSRRHCRKLEETHEG